MVGVSVDSRYVALGYYGSKATWMDGRSSATFSYYGVYEPFTQHEAIACFLWDVHLGSDDELPTHLLLCDRTDNKMYVGEIKAIEKFLDEQHPPRQPMTPEQWIDAKKYIESLPPPTMEELKQQGMFEMFGRISQEQQKQKLELEFWLDTYITKPIVERYLAEARAGNFLAIECLHRMRERFGAASAEN